MCAESAFQQLEKKLNYGAAATVRTQADSSCFPAAGKIEQSRRTVKWVVKWVPMLHQGGIGAKIPTICRFANIKPGNLQQITRGDISFFGTASYSQASTFAHIYTVDRWGRVERGEGRKEVRR